MTLKMWQECNQERLYIIFPAEVLGGVGSEIPCSSRADLATRSISTKDRAVQDETIADESDEDDSSVEDARKPNQTEASIAAPAAARRSSDDNRFLSMLQESHDN